MPWPAIVMAAAMIISTAVEAGVESSETDKALATDRKLAKKSQGEFLAKQARDSALAHRQLREGKRSLEHKRKMYSIEEQNLADKQKEIKQDVQHSETQRLGSLMQMDDADITSKQNKIKRWGV